NTKGAERGRSLPRGGGKQWRHTNGAQRFVSDAITVEWWHHDAGAAQSLAVANGALLQQHVAAAITGQGLGDAKVARMTQHDAHALAVDPKCVDVTLHAGRVWIREEHRERDVGMPLVAPSSDDQFGDQAGRANARAAQFDPAHSIDFEVANAHRLHAFDVVT